MNKMNTAVQGLHQGGIICTSGDPASRAQAAMVMLHGRGAGAQDILMLADELGVGGFTFFAPQAAGNTWYPRPFLAPLSENEPWLTSALAFVDDTLERILRDGISLEHTILLGFSQGACLALEFAARHARRYGGLVGLSGGLIGPDDNPRQYAGSLSGTPVFLGCSDVDPHIPARRVDLTADVLRGIGGSVVERLYPNMEHVVGQDEIDYVRRMMNDLLARP